MSPDPGADEVVLRDLPATIASGLEIIAARALSDPDDARDAVQETLARAVEAVRCGRIPPGVPLGAFVHGIARHVIADTLRLRQRERQHISEDSQLRSHDPSPLDQLVAKEQQDGVRRAVRRLARRDRELLHRCFVNGERVVQIAAGSREPAERIRQRKSRALKRLRAILESGTARHVSPSSATERL